MKNQKKVRPKFNPNCQKDKLKAAYICDGHGCDRNCADMRPEEWAKYPCHHTLDESHAKNKIRRNRKFECKNGGYYEVEK